MPGNLDESRHVSACMYSVSHGINEGRLYSRRHSVRIIISAQQQFKILTSDDYFCFLLSRVRVGKNLSSFVRRARCEARDGWALTGSGPSAIAVLIAGPREPTLREGELHRGGRLRRYDQLRVIKKKNYAHRRTLGPRSVHGETMTIRSIEQLSESFCEKPYPDTEHWKAIIVYSKKRLTLR